MIRLPRLQAPKRPKALPCDVHHTKVTKRLDKTRTFDYVIFVGLFNNDPYEIFVMENGFLDKKYKNGKLIKKTKGIYSVELEDGTIIEDVTKDASESEDVLTRLVSTSLRHGTSISFIVDQLQKSEGDLYCFSKAISRVLKKYIIDNNEILGNCPECKIGIMVRADGCKVCQSCNHSFC
jgi:ribonucleoside-diphosphate reductase alpha chain